MILKKLCEEYCFIEDEIVEEACSLQGYIMQYDRLNRKVCYEHIDYIDDLKELLSKLDTECNKECFFDFLKKGDIIEFSGMTGKVVEDNKNYIWTRPISVKVGKDIWKFTREGQYFNGGLRIIEKVNGKAV